MTLAPTPVHRRPPPGIWVAVLAAAAVALAALAVAVIASFGPFGSSSTSSGSTGSGHALSQARRVGPFARVELAGSSQVTVTVGPARSVVVRADDNLVGRVTTVVRDGGLVIGTKPGSYRTRIPMSVAVTVPSLDAIVLSGSGLVTVSGVRRAHLQLSTTGSGLLRASGRADRLDAVLSGSGDMQLEQLRAKAVHAVVSGSGRIVVTSTERLDAEVPGSGAIVYAGNPAHVSTSITGSGAVTRW